MLRSRCLIAVGSSVITVLLALALPATAATASPGPQLARAGAPGASASPAAGGSNDFLNGDSCTSSTFCMAVGSFTLNGHTPGLSEMLSGTKWVAKSVPSPSHGVNVFANEVSCASSTSCLFVGDHFAGPHSQDANLAEAWDGTSWRIVADTGPAGQAFSVLTDVACPTAKFCLVTGQAGNNRRNQDTAYTWTNGTTWKRITVPSPRRALRSDLGGLACVNAFNCMGVGNYTSSSGVELAFAAHWQSGQWKLLAMPSVRGQRFTSLNGVSCPTASRCVAVGNTEDKTRGEFFHAVAEVWSGGTWHISMFRKEPSVFFGVSCTAMNHCFASGDTFPGATNTAHPLIESWNGRTWTIQHPVQTFAPHHGDLLVHVSCVSRSRCEAVGLRFHPGVPNSDVTLAELWNGHRWTVQTTANP